MEIEEVPSEDDDSQDDSVVQYIENNDFNNICAAARKRNTVILKGDAGVGKTTSVHHYTKTQCTAEELFLKVRCSSKAQFQTDLRQLALRHPEILLSELDYQTVGRATESFLNKLMITGRKFVILFDDADDTDAMLRKLLKQLSSPRNIGDRGIIFLTTQKPVTVFEPEQFEIVAMKGFTKEQFCEALRDCFKEKIQKITDEQIMGVISRVGLFPVVLKSMIAEANERKETTPEAYLLNYLSDEAMTDGAYEDADEKALRQIRKSVDRSLKLMEYPKLGRMVAKTLWFLDSCCISNNHLRMVCEMILLHRSKLGDFDDIQEGNSEERLADRLFRDFLKKFSQRGLLRPQGVEPARTHSLEGITRQVFCTMLDEDGDAPKYFRVALEALIRIFPANLAEDDKCSILPHAVKVETAFDSNTWFQSLTTKTMMIQLWKSMAFWYLFVLWDDVNGYQKLKNAIRTFCHTFDRTRTGQRRFCSKRKRYWCESDGDKLFELCSGNHMIMGSADLCDFIESIPRYQCLRAFQKHNLFGRHNENKRTNKEWNGHLSKSGFNHLKEEDQQQGAIGPDERFILDTQLRIKTYLVEAVANIFFIYCDMASNALYSQGLTTEKQIKKLHKARNAGLIARRMYQRLEREHGVVVHKGVVNARAVCRIQAKLMRIEIQPSLFELSHWQKLQALLADFKNQSRRAGNSYEYGLLVSHIHCDLIHELRCKEGVIYILGAMMKYKLGSYEFRRAVTEYLRDYNCEQLIVDALDYVAQNPRIMKPYLQHHTTYMRVAEFRFDSGQIHEAIDMAIKGLIHYSNDLRRHAPFSDTEISDKRPEVDMEDPAVMKYGLSRLKTYLEAWSDTLIRWSAGSPGGVLRLSDESYHYLSTFKTACRRPDAPSDESLPQRFSIISECLRAANCNESSDDSGDDQHQGDDDGNVDIQ